MNLSGPFRQISYLPLPSQSSYISDPPSVGCSSCGILRSFQENNSQRLLSVIKFKLLSKTIFFKTYICHRELNSFPLFKDLSDEPRVILANVIFTLCNEMCQHLEELHNTMNQYFPSDQSMTWQNYALVKDQFEVQD